MAYDDTDVDELEQDQDEEQQPERKGLLSHLAKMGIGGTEPIASAKTPPFLAEQSPQPSITGATAPLAAPAPTPTSVTAQPLGGTQPIVPPVNPAEQRLQTLEADKPAVTKKHGIGGGILNTLDVLGSALAPGITSRIPGTRENYRRQIADLSGQATEQERLNQEQEQESTQEQNLQSEIPLRQAQTGEANARAQAIAHPPAKPQSATGIAALAKLGYKLDEQGTPVPMTDEEISPEVKSMRDFQTASSDLKRAQTALANSKNDPNSAAYKLEQAKVDEARERTHQAAAALGLHEQEFQNNVQEQDLVKPSGQSQSRASAATAAQGVIKELQAELQDPEVRSQFGPLIGRMNSAGKIVGTIPPKLSAAATHLENLYALMGTAHGWRAIEAPEQFRKAMGGMERNPAAIDASFNAANQDLGTISTEGKTYHHRIVEPASGEGHGETSGKEIPKAGDVVKGYRFKGGDPSQKNSWEKVSGGH